MRHWTSPQIQFPTEQFKVISTTDKTQIALMTLSRMETSGPYGTDHPRADQVIIAVSGLGAVRVGKEEFELNPGDVLLIEAGEEHQITGISEESFVSLSVYGPIAYPDEA